MNTRYAFPLCIQLAVPDDIYHDKNFKATLQLLKEYGFYGVELNITDFDNIKPLELTGYLSDFDLKLTMVATGMYAKQNGLSLSSLDEETRKKTVQHMNKIMAFAEQAKAGIICGFIKGGPDNNVAAATKQMELSLLELSRLELVNQVDIYLEATNHYEATLVNTVLEGVNFSAKAGTCIKILPDTYHMNIEETNMFAAMVKYQNYYKNIHISDNNRYFPGLGGIDFFAIISVLKSLNYSGTITIEGRCLKGLHEDIAVAANYIHNVSQRI
ncbi:sugar phosphate isomerase/epimerase family protein [Sporomusa aerivorans]|uniref:sugar phosphate isomerase/epimerase family protein n=1 Tax=Sporomusa aerivorans TaxID=204936 RepID=UPI003529E5C0